MRSTGWPMPALRGGDEPQGHDAERGDLLGAFSYVLQLAPSGRE